MRFKLGLSQEELEKKVPAIKLALMSEKAMNDRMDSIVRKATDRRSANQQLEDDERMIAGFDRIYHMTDGRITNGQ